MAQAKTRAKPKAKPAERNGSVHPEWSCVVIPASAATLAGFRAWTSSDGFPEFGNITFLEGEIIVDMSAERYYSHGRVKVEVMHALADLVTEKDLGLLVPDRGRFVNPGADLSCEPDLLFVSWEAFESGRVREIPTADGDDVIELEGSPDWVLEIASPSSEVKDTKKLFASYARAGVTEYWLIDARGEAPRFEVFSLVKGQYRAVKPKPDGWLASKVFGKQFRLSKHQDRRGKPGFRLEVR
jgi:Uma2 family endonuclease